MKRLIKKKRTGMSETPKVIVALLAGGFLGAIFFAGLWWTIRKGVSSRLPALWFSGSLFVRMAIVLPGFYFATCGHWPRIVACLTGFLLARMAVTRMVPVRSRLQGGAT
jgi:F1F0 ATPase subunit 2